MMGNILVVDDNNKNLRLLGDVLEVQGHRIETAASGAEALHRVQDWCPDLILMDVQMPGMSGTETMQTMRQDARLQHTPIVAVTALAMSGDERTLLEAGFDAYLSKPVALKALLQTVVRLLGG